MLSQYLASLRVVNVQPIRCYQHGAAGPWQVVILIAGSKRRSLLMAGDDDEAFMIRSLNVTRKTTKQYLIVGGDKHVACTWLTIKDCMCSTFCTIEANYWQTRTSGGLFARAELLVYTYLKAWTIIILLILFKTFYRPRLFVVTKLLWFYISFFTARCDA